jgi:hypothetical protein
MAKNLTVNISLNGEIDFEKINETIRKEIERVSVKVEIPKYRKVTDREARVGDFVKFEGSVASYLQAKEYYEIVEIDYSDDPHVIDDDGDDFDAGGYNYEVFERVACAEEQALRVGDYAKVIELCSGEVDTEIGDIVEVVSLHSGGGFIRYEVLRNKHRSGMYAKRFVKATDEEVAEAQEAAKWAKIGRKPAEFKKGDIVRVNRVHIGAHPEGTFGEVQYDYVLTDGIGPRIVAMLRDGRFVALHSPAELITPVEQRFDHL